MIQNRIMESPKREILVFYYKYRRRLMASFWLPFLAFVALSFVPTPRFQADSTMVVRLGSEYVYQPESGSANSGQPSPIPFERDQIYKAEVAILDSNDLHQQVIGMVGLDRMYPQKDGGLLRGILRPVCGSMVAFLDSLFPDDADDSFWGSTASSIRIAVQDYADDRNLTPEEKARRRLELATVVFEKNLKISLEKESAVINIAFQHKNREIAIEALDVLQKLYMEKRKALYLETRGSVAKESADSIHHRVTNLQAEIENFKREHKIYSLADQRAALLLQREDVRKQMMNVSSIALEDRLSNLTGQLDALDALERRYNALQQDLQVANDEYTIFAHKLDEAQSYDSIERARAGSVRIIQPPAAPPEPKKLQLLIILGGFILSLLMTAAVAAFTEFSRSGFLTPERLERALGLPVLSVVPLRK